MNGSCPEVAQPSRGRFTGCRRTGRAARSAWRPCVPWPCSRAQCRGRGGLRRLVTRPARVLRRQAHFARAAAWEQAHKPGARWHGSRHARLATRPSRSQQKWLALQAWWDAACSNCRCCTLAHQDARTAHAPCPPLPTHHHTPQQPSARTMLDPNAVRAKSLAPAPCNVMTTAPTLSSLQQPSCSDGASLPWDCLEPRLLPCVPKNKRVPLFCPPPPSLAKYTPRRARLARPQPQACAP